MSAELAEEPRRWLSDSLLLSFLVGGSYWITFRYESAYIKTFGFPIQLTEISLVSSLLVLLLLSGIMWSLVPFANLLAMFWPKHPAFQVKFARVALLVGLPVWNLLNYGFRSKDLPYYIFMIVFVLLFEIVWPLFVFKGKGKLRERFIADEAAEAFPSSRTLFGRVYVAFGPLGYGLLLFILIGGLLAHSAGDAKAHNEKEYLVLISDPTIAVIRLYQDRALCVRIDAERGEIESISVRPSIDANVELKRVKVGPLKPRDDIMKEAHHN